MTPRILTLAIAIAFATTSALAAPVPKNKQTAAEKLAGRWQLMKSNGKAPLQPHFVVFTKDGKMTLEVGDGDSPTKYTGKFTATNDAIDYELKMGTIKTEKLKILAFTADELKTADPDDIEEEFSRVKEKK